MPVIDSNIFCFQGYTLDLRRGCLRRDDHEIKLRPKSFAILRHLVENAGRLISKDELIATVWANVNVTDVSLARCVSDVRLALQDQEQRIIRTAPRRGYLFAAPVSAGESATTGRTHEQRPEQRSAERRQLTAVACEVVSLRAPSERFDPEDRREATTEYYRRYSEIIRRHHGTVVRHDNDGLLAWFGYPEVHEHDAENAVRAMLGIRNLAAGLSNEDTRLKPCIGMATGTVVIGDERDAVNGQKASGEALTLSARLRDMAEPGQIVIAESTRRLVGGLFEYHDLGHVALKGLAEPVEICRVLGESETESRFDAQHPASLTPIVGREDEIELFRRRWRQAKDGEGSVVLLSGEPGIGKSRIAQEVMALPLGEEHAGVRLYCSPYHQDSPLHPFISQLGRSAEFRRSDTDERRLIKLETALAGGSGNATEAVPLLAELLSIPTGDRFPRLTLAPRERGEKTLEALLARIEGLAASRPTVLVIEDVHWADPTSLELIDRIVARAPRLKLLVIITFRPTFVPPWTGRVQTISIAIGRLSPRQCADVMAGVTNGKRLPREVADAILARTDGVPLFVEELTKAVVTSGVLTDAGDHFTMAGPLPEPALPMTLNGSLLTRLDRLGAAREVAQIGAALGRRFSHEMIGAVATMPRRDLDDALDRLVSAELIWRHGQPPDEEFTFRHALLQDAAYGMLPRGPRRALHARIAKTLEGQFADIVESEPERLAHHYHEAGLIEQAASLWGKAGQLSLTRSGLKEAEAHLARALNLIETLPGTPALRREQIRLRISFANALMHTKGYAAPETRASLDQARLLFERAVAMGEPPEDPLLLFSVLHGFWVANHVAFNGDLVRELAVQFIALAKTQNRTFLMVLAHRLMGTSLLYLGEIAEGRAHLDRAITLYDPDRHRTLATEFGHDAGVAIVSNRTLALWLLGYPQAALKDAEDAVRSARDMGQAATLLYALTRTASFHLVGRNYQAAAAEVRELISIAEQIEGTYWKAAGTMIQGCLSALTGEACLAIPMIMAGITDSRAAGANLRMPWNLSCLAWAHARMGELDEAWRWLDEAMAVMQATRETWQEPELHRMAGDLTLMAPNPDEAKAEAHLRRALVVARQQAAKSWELRAAMSLARLWRSQCKWEQALELLAPIHDWFTEGFETPDLIEARTLLGELENRLDR